MNEQNTLQKSNNIYLILFDWSTNDCDGIETFLYYHFEDALKKFNELIENECDPDMSWVGDEVFDENVDVNDGYDLECNTDDKTAARSSTYSKEKFIKEIDMKKQISFQVC